METENYSQRYDEVVRHLNRRLAGEGLNGIAVAEDRSVTYTFTFEPTGRELMAWFYSTGAEVENIKRYAENLPEKIGGVKTPAELGIFDEHRLNELAIAVTTSHGDLGNLVQFSTDGSNILARNYVSSATKHHDYRKAMSEIDDPKQAIDLAMKVLVS
jgi:hypothetical protein